MKFSNIMLALAIIASTVIIACGGGKLGEAEKAEMSKFDGDFLAEVTILKSTPDMIKKAIDDSKAMCDSSCNNTECKKDMKEKCDSLKTSCNTIHTDMEALLTSTGERIKQADADLEAWNQWKAKAEKGEVKPEDYKKAMEDWKLKMSDIKASFTEWKGKLDELTSQCKTNCESAGECCE